MAASLNAFVTLVTSDTYLPGALVALHSLLDAEGPNPEVAFETVCLVTPESVSVQTIRALRQAFSLVVGVDAIRTNSHRELNLLGRQDLGAAMTKLHLWRLVQFRKVIYLDADTLVLRPLSHLFHVSEPFAAAPDQGWPDCFNTGVMVCTPDAATFDAILDLNDRGGSWDGADQGLLNDFFEDRWHRLSFTYNVTPSAYYQFQPAYRRHGSGIKLVHFIGLDKPWHRLNRHRRTPTTSVQAANDYFGLLDRWFDVYERHFGQLSTAALASSSTSTSGSAFVVPMLASVWDGQGGRGALAYRAPSPEQLKTMFGGAASALGSALASRDTPEGLYASMPHRGRSDYTQAPSPPSASAEAQRPPSPPRGDPSASGDHGGVWNALQGPPPSESGPAGWQVREPIQHHYENIWDQRGSHDSAGFFRPPRYAPPPENVRGQYQSAPSDPRSVKAIFPWEAERDKQRPTRVFPDDPARRSVHFHAPPATTDPSRPNLQYTNAWDNISGIRRYAEGLQAPQPAPAAAISGGTPRPTQRAGGSLSGSGQTSPSKSRGSQHTSPPQSASRSGAHGRRASSDLSALPGHRERRGSDYERGGEASSRDGDDEDDDEEEEESPGEVKEPKKPRRPSAPQPLPSGPPRPASILRPHIRRDNGSMGSVSRMPTLGGFEGAVDVAGGATEGAVLPAEASLTAADVKRSSANGGNRSKATRQITPSSTATSPSLAPSATASRIFDPATSSDIIRREGLESLQRFVKSMEAKGEAAASGPGTARESAK